MHIVTRYLRGAQGKTASWPFLHRILLLIVSYDYSDRQQEPSWTVMQIVRHVG